MRRLIAVLVLVGCSSAPVARDAGGAPVDAAPPVDAFDCSRCTPVSCEPHVGTYCECGSMRLSVADLCRPACVVDGGVTGPNCDGVPFGEPLCGGGQSVVCYQIP